MDFSATAVPVDQVSAICRSMAWIWGLAVKSGRYENLNTVDNEIADESSLIFEFLIGNENYTDWQ